MVLRQNLHGMTEAARSSTGRYFDFCLRRSSERLGAELLTYETPDPQGAPCLLTSWTCWLGDHFENKKMTRNAGWEVQRILLYERSWGNPQRVCVVGFGWNWGVFLNFWIIVCLKLMLGTWSERDEIQIASWTVHEVFWYIKTERNQETTILN